MAVLDAVIERRVRGAIEVLVRQMPVRAAYVFGSHAEGRADTWSDIDIAVFIDGVENWDLCRRARTAAWVQKEAGDDLELHFFPAQRLTDPPPASFVAFILRHGISVGDLEARP